MSLNGTLKTFIALLLITLAGGASQAVPAIPRLKMNPQHPYSAKRAPGESFEEARNRFLTRLGVNPLLHLTGGAQSRAMQQDGADPARAPEWRAGDDMQTAFERLRDTRFLEESSRPGFKRRSSWMYPDDGCFARAALMANNLKDWGYPSPAKVFIFGALRVNTNNAPSGSVSWWYHVVPAYRVEGKIVIFDPAVEAMKPLLLDEWSERVNADGGSIKIAICASTAYNPFDECDAEVEGGHQRGAQDQLWYLSSEWNRIVDLKRNPEKELGDEPPWLQLTPAPAPLGAAPNETTPKKETPEIKPAQAPKTAQPPLFEQLPMSDSAIDDRPATPRLDSEPGQIQGPTPEQRNQAPQRAPQPKIDIPQPELKLVQPLPVVVIPGRAI